MNLDVQAQTLGLGENAAGFIGCERSGFDKHVAKLCELACCDSVEILNHLIHERGSILTEFGGQCVRAKVCRHDFECFLGSHRFEYPNLGLEIEPIAALRLDRGRAVFEESIRKLDAKAGSLPSGVHAGKNTTAAGENVHIWSALNAPFKLVGACACEYGVSVGIDEAGKDNLAGGVEFGRGPVW